jgi:S-methyl-5-thioribose-1-phosphate isomerase
MQVNGRNYQTIWMKDFMVRMIDQNLLPYEFKIFTSRNYIETCFAIRTMIVRGAGAIGAAAAFAMAQAALEANSRNYRTYIETAKAEIESTRPTARNLFAATEKVYQAALISQDMAVKTAKEIAQKDKDDSKLIGDFGNELIKDGYRIETHCNAGWLAFVDHGTALSPIYRAKEAGKNVFVYVDETRPRGQGAKLTAWELLNENIPHAVIADNAGAHLMSQGKIDMLLVGADRISLNGDVANKIGTLEKAIAAKYYNIPFYVAAPLSTFDFSCRDGKEIKIEERDQNEVLFQTGTDKNGNITEIRVAAPNAKAINPAFDVTPAELITGIITEKGIIKPNLTAIQMLRT